jgi:3-methyladenine DNA glycosylase AlkD
VIERRVASSADILAQLNAKADPTNLEGMARYGMTVEKRLGVSVPEMRRIAKAAGKDHAAALELWETGIAEARIVASLIAVPEKLTEEQMEGWVKDFDSWDVCDQVCMNLFDKSPLARRKIVEWSTREEEYVKRAAFALLAAVAAHDRRMTDDELIAFLPVIERGATDERNFVKKAVNWALRTIGKRDLTLNEAAIRAAKEIQRLDSRAARWIAADALRELQSEKIQRRL